LHDLQTDYLDVLLLHRPSPLLEVNEVAEAVATLVSSGKIQSFGVSNFLPSQVEWLSKQVKIEHNQIAFSLSDFKAMENGNLDSFASQNLSVAAYSPIIHLENTSAELKLQLTSLSEKYNCTEAILAVAWVLQHPLISSVVVGTSKLERVQEMCRALDVRLSIQDYFFLWEAARGIKVP
jgi:predicted oxidoreductase